MEGRLDDGDLPVTGEPGSPGSSSLPGIECAARRAREEFPQLEEPSANDLLVIERQLGRRPQGAVFVARRCPHGRPFVILTLPFEREGGGHVPPLLWLSCPHLAREVSRMEGGGATRRFAEALEPGGEHSRERTLFLEEEERFGKVQAGLAAACGPGLASRWEKKGVAGGRRGAVKCLHAHLAYWLASERGVVGGWCLEEISNGSGSSCERTPEACLA
jgi:uncharacterized protein